MAAVVAWAPHPRRLGHLVIVIVVTIVTGAVVVVMDAGIGMKADLVLGSAVLLPGIGTDRQLREEGVEEVVEEEGRGKSTATEVLLEVVGI